MSAPEVPIISEGPRGAAQRSRARHLAPRRPGPGPWASPGRRAQHCRAMPRCAPPPPRRPPPAPPHDVADGPCALHWAGRDINACARKGGGVVGAVVRVLGARRGGGPVACAAAGNRVSRGPGSGRGWQAWGERGQRGWGGAVGAASKGVRARGRVREGGWKTHASPRARAGEGARPGAPGAAPGRGRARGHWAAAAADARAAASDGKRCCGSVPGLACPIGASREAERREVGRRAPGSGIPRPRPLKGCAWQEAPFSALWGRGRAGPPNTGGICTAAAPQNAGHSRGPAAAPPPPPPPSKVVDAAAARREAVRARRPAPRHVGRRLLAQQRPVHAREEGVALDLLRARRRAQLRGRGGGGGAVGGAEGARQARVPRRGRAPRLRRDADGGRGRGSCAAAPAARGPWRAAW